VSVLAAINGLGLGLRMQRIAGVDVVVAFGLVAMGFLCVRFYTVQALYWSMRSRSTVFAMVIALLFTVVELFVGCFVPIVAFLNPVGCGLWWSDSAGKVTFFVVGLGVSYLLYRWIVGQWLHRMLVVFQASVQEER
jgi:hypothetical protein